MILAQIDEEKKSFLWLPISFLTTYNFEFIENRGSFLPVKIIKIEGTINSDEKRFKSLTQFKGKNLIC